LPDVIFSAGVCESAHESVRNIIVSYQIVTDRARQISDLLVQTRASLENARNGNWEQVISDEQCRQRMISELFSQPLDAREADDYHDVIQQVLLLNRELEQFTTDARDRARQEAGSISKGRRALDMYSANLS
jgi:hypothetical protein